MLEGSVDGTDEQNWFKVIDELNAERQIESGRPLDVRLRLRSSVGGGARNQSREEWDWHLSSQHGGAFRQPTTAYF